MPKSTKPDILLFGSGQSLVHKKVQQKIEKDIEKKANVHKAELDKASQLLEEFPSARAILICDSNITQGQHSNLSSQVIDYVKKRGGTVIILFSLVRDEMNRWFKDSWGMPWEVGRDEKEKTTVYLQDSHALAGSSKSRLTASYLTPAVFLQNVRPSDSLYASQLSARVNSATNSPSKSPVATSIAFGKYGWGWLGFVGDGYVAQDETVAAMLVMSNLLDQR
ncbi:hypothetical protein GGR51DRAFT_562203 [Nemania sp. FL0031]|nr:hypothetical protein GGR51DRAFT_562203 [Nemania sp. FL0031]